MPSSVYLLILNGAILTACAVFIESERQLLLTALMLFLPLLDKNFIKLKFKPTTTSLFLWLVPASLITLLMLVDPSQQASLASIMLLTALPEEWFFRRYFQQLLQTLLSIHIHLQRRLSAAWSANIITSLFFALLHLPLQGITGLSVFIPSLFFGWLYQLKQDIIFVILIHGLFNVFFLIFIQPLIHNLPVPGL